VFSAKQFFQKVALKTSHVLKNSAVFLTLLKITFFVLEKGVFSKTRSMRKESTSTTFPRATKGSGNLVPSTTTQGETRLGVSDEVWRQALRSR